MNKKMKNKNGKSNKTRKKNTEKEEKTGDAEGEET